MKISKEALKIISKGSLGISKAVSPNSIGLDLTGLDSDGGKDESNTPDPKDKNKQPDTNKPETKKSDTKEREIDIDAVKAYSSDEGELGYPRFNSFESEANKYNGIENKAPYPPF